MKLGRKKESRPLRAEYSPRQREEHARDSEARAKSGFAEYRRTKDPLTLARARLSALSAEAWRRAVDIEDLPVDLRRKYHLDESRAIIERDIERSRAAHRRHQARNGGAR